MGVAVSIGAAAGPAARSSSGGNEADVDFAVETTTGAWCTTPQPGEPDLVVRSIEGWVRLKARKAGVLLDLGTSSRDRPGLRVAVTEEPSLVLEGAGVSVASQPLRVAPDLWTHFQLDVAPGALRLAVWDYATGSRSVTPTGSATASANTRLCVGGSTPGTAGLSAWVDEIRLWSAVLPEDVAGAWRHRRLSQAHPLSGTLVASWPFRSGTGATEAGEGHLGALTTEQPRWIDLPRLAYGPVLRSVRSRSARFLFGARTAAGTDVPWLADVAIQPAEGGSRRGSMTPVAVGAATDFVGHVQRDGLQPQTRYAYIPLIDGRAAVEGPREALPVFTTAPELGSRNADFTAVFLADQHTPETTEVPRLSVYAAALADRALFWAQLGDVVPGSTDGRTVEHKRDAQMLRALWARNFGAWDSPQAGFIRTVPLGFATISDHEITNNYDLNWHHHAYAGAASPESSTLGDRIRQYDVSMARWWNHLGWGADVDDELARAARGDFGRAVMGDSYATPGLYHGWRPYPFVEFFVLDTTSYRGDTYQFRERYGRTDNRDIHHARHRWNPNQGSRYIFGDREHGANETTDRIRSWLGPTQKSALLAALRASTARVIVVAAGYPLYSYKFEGDARYWEGRESGFDFAVEVEELIATLDRLDRLVLWVHGDGHTPALVRLRKNLYQLQIGPTMLASGGTGHRSHTLGSGSRSRSDLVGGGLLIATHQPDLSPGDPANDVFRGGLDTFEGYLRLYFHPGQEALRSSGRAGARRGGSDDTIEVPQPVDPARQNAGRLVVGSVARLRFGDETVHAVVTGYRYEDGRAVFRLDPAVVRADPEEFRILVDAVPWVEATWFDAEGQEWRDLSSVLRREP